MRKKLLTGFVALTAVAGAMHLDIKKAEACMGPGCFPAPRAHGFSFQMSIGTHGVPMPMVGPGFMGPRPMVGPVRPPRGAFRRRMGCAGFRPCGVASRQGRRMARRSGCFGRCFKRC